MSTAPRPDIIKKGYLYDDEGGTDYISDFAAFAQDHIQDDETAIAIAERMLREDDISENFDEGSRIFEVYTVVNRSLLRAQIDAYKQARRIS